MLVADVLGRRRAVLVDLDGCFLAGDRLAPGAADLFSLVGERLVVLSNNSTHTPRQMATMLLGQGASIPARNIILAGAAAVEELAWARPEARVLAVAGPAICALAAERGLRLVEESAEAVLLCRHPGLRYADIADAVQALHRGTELWVANPDLTHPAADGTPVPETGAVLAALLACVHAAQPRMVGKPAPLLFRQALGLMGCRAAEAAMIGDNPATDGAGVAAVGMPFLLVGRGEGALAADLDSLLAERRDSVTELSGRYHRSVTAPE